MKYYFLVSYLPEIHRDDRKIRLGFGDLLEERNHVAPEDWREVELVLLGRDVFLLEGLLKGKESTVEHTLHDVEFWKEQIKSPREVAVPLAEFLESASGQALGPEETDRLYETYYSYVMETTASPFLRAYFQFEKDLRNIISALRARRKGQAPSEHVVGEGDVVELLGRSSAEDFGLAKDVPWMDRLLEAKDPLGFDEVREQILWEYLEERIEPKQFEFDVVLSYLLRLELLEKRLALRAERGMEIVRQLEEF